MRRKPLPNKSAHAANPTDRQGPGDVPDDESSPHVEEPRNENISDSQERLRNYETTTLDAAEFDRILSHEKETAERLNKAIAERQETQSGAEAVGRNANEEAYHRPQHGSQKAARLSPLVLDREPKSTVEVRDTLKGQGRLGHIPPAPPTEGNAEPTELAAENRLRLDESETSERDHFEKELLPFQEEEAWGHIKTGDHKPAIENIKDVLRNKFLGRHEGVYWSYEYVFNLQMAGRWQDSVDEISKGELFFDKLDGRPLRMLAEGLYQLGRHEEARTAGIKSLRLLEDEIKNGDASGFKAGLMGGDLNSVYIDKAGALEPPDPRVAFDMSIEVMSRITGALGKPAEAKFYKSKVVEGHTSRVFLEKQRKDAVLKKERDELAQLIKHRKELLGKHGILYDHDTKTGKARLLGQQGRSFDVDIIRAFKIAMKESDNELADLLLLDGQIIWRRARESPDDPNAVTAFHCAAESGNIEYLRRLLDIGADPNVASNTTNTKYQNTPCDPLSLAATRGNLEVVIFLLDHGADASARQRVHRNRSLLFTEEVYRVTTPLHQSIKHGYPKITNVLLDRRADPRVYDRDGRFPIHVAAEAGLDDVVELLLNNGALVDDQTREGLDTSLHIAARRGLVSTVRLLLSHGASTQTKNKKQLNPLSQMRYYDGREFPDFGEVKRILREHEVQRRTSWVGKKMVYLNM